jgi:siroheme synthase-like protein
VNSTVTIHKNPLYPVFLKLENMHLLLIGAGNIGMEKLQSLLANSPATRITIVSITVSEQVIEFVAGYEHIEIFEKAFEEADLDGKDIVISATGDREFSEVLRELCKERRILINVADTPDLCDFYLGSIVQKGNLKIAISTNGKSPTAAKRIKEMLNQSIPSEIDDTLENLHSVRKQLTGDFSEKVKKMNEITRVLVEKGKPQRDEKWRKLATRSLLVFGVMLLGHFIFSYIPLSDLADGTVDFYKKLDPSIHWMILAGFLAQMVDGALGMGYGVTSATILLSIGVNPAAISGSIHTAEMFASGASGYSHYKFGNVNKKMFKALLVPGVLGAIAGAVFLVKLGTTHADYLRPIMAVYTMFLGIRIFINAFRKARPQKKFRHYGWLAGAGGFLDSFGGGGWGPIVTTTLITKGRTPKYVIGSVSLTEFFVTLASAFTFFTLLGVSHWQTIVALILGGFIAAPFAAKLAGRLPKKTSFILLGVLVMIWSLRILIKAV